MKTIKLSGGERIIAVVPEYAGGPGWANQPVWVYIATSDNRLRQECIQPAERSPALDHLFTVGAAMHAALVNAVPVKTVKG